MCLHYGMALFTLDWNYRRFACLHLSHGVLTHAFSCSGTAQLLGSLYLLLFRHCLPNSWQEVFVLIFFQGSMRLTFVFFFLPAATEWSTEISCVSLSTLVSAIFYF